MDEYGADPRLSCDTLAYPQTSYTPHDCSSSAPVSYAGGYDCNYSDPAASPTHQDEWQTTINAGLCTPNPPAFGSWGKCLPRSFTRQRVAVNGNPGTPNGIYQTDSCSCQDHLDMVAAAKVCYIHGDTNNTMYLCKCH